MSARSTELIQAFDAFCNSHESWVDDDNRKEPDASYWDSFETLKEVFEHGDIPYEAKEFCEKAQKFFTIGDLFLPQVLEGAVVSNLPQEGFWAALEDTVAARDRLVKPAVPVTRRLETMKELDAQGVSHEQIARMYGLTLPDGYFGDASLVRQELLKPGSVIGPDWKHPDDVKREQQEEAMKREFASQQSMKPKKKPLGKQTPAPCPESPYQLWLEKVSVEQSARMLQKGEEEVAALFAGFDSQVPTAAQ